MSFMRPEAAETLWRWREVLAGGACFALGGWLAVTSYGALFLIGCGAVIAGAALIAAGVQRGRFRQGGGGLGIVDVDERQITYFGPFGGGSMAIEELVEVSLDGSGNWLLRDSRDQSLLIPVKAEGADTLFDAFTVLPGLSGARLIEAMRATPSGYRMVWAKPQGRLH